MKHKQLNTAGPSAKPQDDIPQTKQLREQILQAAQEYVRQRKPVGPLSLDELKRHCDKFIERYKINPKHFKFAGVLINNEIWREKIGCIPYNKRLLLLPKCLRSEESCHAKFDNIGLLCEDCGSCVLSKIKTQAEQLGYTVLIAEGSPIVVSLIETGKIEAVIGVSCLSMLEQTFPYLEASAVPAIAIPLLYDGCRNTNADTDWILDAIYQGGSNEGFRLDLKDLRVKVNQLFAEENLKRLLAVENDPTELLALDWLLKAGKRQRPFLAVCVHKTISKEENDYGICDSLAKIAVAVECFHKASLIHDDIEDGDTVRYSQKTLHAEYGIPVALNVGDFLLGEGYRLLSEAAISADQRVKLIQTAAQGHRKLCLGQGKELMWMRQPTILTADEVIDIFRKKTSPAFEVAIKLGLISAQPELQIDDLLNQYSTAIGIAYQINDDIEDFDTGKLFDNPNKTPSLLTAIAFQKAEPKERKILDKLWEQSQHNEDFKNEISNLMSRLKVRKAALDMLENYKMKAISTLYPLENADLKSLLRRIISKIFNEIDIMSCCDDNKRTDD